MTDTKAQPKGAPKTTATSAPNKPTVRAGGAGGSDFHHGVQVVEIHEGSRPIRTIATSIIGFTATAPDADAEMFPLNKPLLITNVRAAMGKAGTEGTLYKVLEAISKNANAVCVVVIVEEGATPEETTSNVVGKVLEDGTPTGLKALRIAEQKLGLKPRILGAPGLDTQAVTTELISIAKSLRGFAYAACVGKSLEEAFTYRQNFSARELMLIDSDFLDWNVNTNQEDLTWATAYALGLRAYIDNEMGWHKTLSNVAVTGPTGTTSNRTWDLQDPNTDINLLNAKEITGLVNFKGYRFWGNRTCSDDPLFAFEAYTRTAHVLADTVAEAHFHYVDKVMTPANVLDIVESVNAKLRQLVRDDYLLGARCWYDPDANTKEELKAGGVTIHYDYTPVPPMENMKFVQKITDEYFIDFNAAVAQAS